MSEKVIIEISMNSESKSIETSVETKGFKGETCLKEMKEIASILANVGLDFSASETTMTHDTTVSEIETEKK